MDKYGIVNRFRQEIIRNLKFRRLHLRDAQCKAKDDQSVQAVFSSSFTEIQGVVEQNYDRRGLGIIYQGEKVFWR